MSSVLLFVARLIMIFISLAVIGADAAIFAKYSIKFTGANWAAWLPIVVGVISLLFYGLYLNRGRPESRENGRAVIALILAVAWFVAPAYKISQIAKNDDGKFFSNWNCGTTLCTLSMITDIGGLLGGIVALIENIFAVMSTRRNIHINIKV